jgi:hypothetical protein
MYSEDDLRYAIENTRVILSPERRIETFGTTSFHFYLVTELMDSVSEIRVRDSALLKYGFQIRKEDLSESLVHDSVEAVLDRVANQVPAALRGSSAVIHGVDEGWEVCLLKFTIEMMQQSAGGNIQDFRRRGML